MLAPSVSADGVHFFTLNPALAPELKNLFPTDSLGRFLEAGRYPAAGNAAFAGLTLDGIRAVHLPLLRRRQRRAVRSRLGAGSRRSCGEP
jgi:hypothetical protein